MLGIILRVVAFLLFVLAAVNQNLFGQSSTDLVAWGLACWVLASVLGGPVVSGWLGR